MTKQRQPKIRFNGFSGDWDDKLLGELSSVQMCKRIFKSETRDKGEIPFYKIGTFGGIANAFINRTLYDEYRKKYPYPEIGDILISASGTIGRTIVYNGEEAYYQDSNIIWLKLDRSTLLNTFLYSFYALAKWNNIEGSTIKRLYNSDILSTSINFPDVEEQTQIGNFFKQLDNVITLHEQKYTQTLNLKKAMLEKMFPKAGCKQPEIRFKGFSGDWKEVALESEVEFYSGLTYSPTNIVKANGTLVLRSSNVQNGEILTDDKIYVCSQKANSENVKIGDIVVVVRNGSRNLIGKHAVIKKQMNNTVIGAFMTGIRAKNSSFINALLDTAKFSLEINKSLGATINQITMGNFRQILFYFPSISEQTKIGNYFKQLDDTLALQAQQLKKLKNIKQAFLENMFV